jgi:hypothetical protein
MTERLEAKEGNIVCPGYDIHKPRILWAGEGFALTKYGDVVCHDCEHKWLDTTTKAAQVPFYPQED